LVFKQRVVDAIQRGLVFMRFAIGQHMPDKLFAQALQTAANGLAIMAIDRFGSNDGQRRDISRYRISQRLQAAGTNVDGVLTAGCRDVNGYMSLLHDDFLRVSGCAAPAWAG